MWQDFKKFAFKGNVFDLAVGVIIGGAFGKIVTSLVGDIIMPLVGLLMGGINLSGLQVQVGKSVVKYGAFLQSVVDFFIVAASIYFVIQAVGKMHKKQQAAPASAPAKPAPEVELLTEIRDLLQKNAR